MTEIVRSLESTVKRPRERHSTLAKVAHERSEKRHCGWSRANIQAYSWNEAVFPHYAGRAHRGATGADDNLCGTVVVVENASKSLSRHDGASVLHACRQRCDELVADALVVPFCVIVLGNTVPTIASFLNSTILGIRSTDVGFSSAAGESGASTQPFASR